GIGCRKGMLKLLQAALLLRKQRPGLRVLFLGRFLTPVDQVIYDDFLQTHDLAGCIIWGGVVSFAEVQAKLCACRVGVALLDTTVPRYRRALSLKILEYLQHGLPVVANDTPLVKQVLASHNVGHCIEHNSFALAAAIGRLLDMTPGQRGALTRRAHRLVREEFCWNSQEPRLLALFERLQTTADNRLLLLSYFYPPLGGPGVQRPCKMVHYLRELGWTADVVSVGDIVTLSYEPDMLRECGHAGLRRTAALDPMWLLRRMKRKRGGEQVYFGASEKRKRIVRGMFPIEDKIGWLPFALAAALRLARRHRYRTVVAVIGPYTAAIAAYFVSKRTGLPLVIDYRDQWTLFPYGKYLTRWHRRLAERWERRILEHASRVSIIGEVYRNELCATFGEHLRSKIHIVRNGWDERDFADAEPLPPSGGLQVRYVGNFNGNRQPMCFVQALRRLKQSGKLPPGLRVTFTGNYFVEAREALSSPDLADIISVEPQVSHTEAVRRELSCDLLLLFIASPNGRGVLTGKMFEYLRAGRPIFCMVPPDGEAARILRDAGHEHICAMEDVASIERLLPAVLKHAAAKPVLRVDDTYSRAAQARQFDAMLRELP
ncbi:MAG: glycosyltransferase, partial [Candidatus Cloacimonetes bacterium]|nr:glycosyltransferase [Candidatus Cloacimonadota bacterium]